MKQLLKHVLELTKKYRGFEIKGLIATVIYSIILGLLPLTSKYIIDKVIPSKSVSSIFIGICIYFFVCISYPIISYIKELIFLYLDQKIVFDMYTELFDKVVSGPISFFYKYKKGDIVSRLVNDSISASNIIKKLFVVIINNTLTILVYLIGMMYISPKITLIIIILYSLFIFINIKSGSKFRAFSKEVRKNYDAIYNSINQVIDGIETIKTFSMEKSQSIKYQEVVKKFNSDNVKIGRYRLLMYGFNDLFELVNLCLIYGLGSIDVMNNNLTIGSIVGLGMYFQCIKYPIEQLISDNINFYASVPIFERIREYLNMESEYYSGEEELNLKRCVRFENVSYRYSNEDKYVLENINLVLPNKGLIVFSGESGCGKTTLIKLLLRFYEPVSGKIYIDDRDITNLGVDLIRKNIGFVSQDVFLLNDTIKNNIVCNKKIPLDDIICLCEKLNLNSRINELENNYDSVLTERTNLSGGEKQRLSIIRALLKKNKILIFDEPTSALDGENEAKVMSILKEISREKLVIVIAHKKIIIESADKLYRFDKQKIFEEYSVG